MCVSPLDISYFFMLVPHTHLFSQVSRAVGVICEYNDSSAELLQNSTTLTFCEVSSVAGKLTMPAVSQSDEFISLCVKTNDANVDCPDRQTSAYAIFRKRRGTDNVSSFNYMIVCGK